LPKLLAKVLDGSISCACACPDEVGEVLLSYLEQVVRLEVGVINEIFIDKFAQGSVLLVGPA
jgi:hypothetical protein